MERAERRFDSLVPADLAKVSDVRNWVGEIARSASLDPERVFDLRVAVSEAVANAIEHARSKVDIVAWPLADRLIIEISNEGVFQPGVHAYDRDRKRGLGLPLMVSLADHVHVARLAGDTTQVSLTFFLSRDHPSERAGRRSTAGLKKPHSEGPTDAVALEQSLRESENRYQCLVDLSPDPILVHCDATLVFANPAAARFFGASSPREIVGRPVLELVHPDHVELAQSRIDLEYAGAVTPPRLGKFVRQDGSAVEAEVVGTKIDFDGRRAIQLMLRDVSERKTADETLRMVNRTLAALSHSNQALIRATGEPDYLQEVCRIVVEVCGHAMAWVGYAEDDEQQSIHPVASAGFEEGYLGTLALTWADRERGRGPTGTAVREGRPNVCHNMLVDPRFSPWREEALKRGYASSIAIPLLANQRAFGAITIYSREPYPFSPDEVRLLVDLAGDVALGVESLRLREAQERAEAERERLLMEQRALSEELSAANEELVRQTDELTVGNERQAAHRRLDRALLEATNSLLSSLDWQRGADRALAAGAKALGADAAALDMWEGDGFRISRVYGVPDNTVGGFVPASLAVFGVEALKTGRTVAVNDTGDRRVPGGLVGDRHIKSLVVAPCFLRGEPRAALFIDYMSVAHQFTEEEIDFVCQLASSLSLALENARLYEEQKNLGRRLQQALLDVPQQTPGVEFGHLYRSATHEALVGGDFHDVFRVKDEQIAVLIGDVSGHGVEAARIATLVKDVVQAFANQFRRPSMIFKQTNELLLERRIPGFVTLFLGILDPRTGLSALFVGRSSQRPAPGKRRQGRPPRSRVISPRSVRRSLLEREPDSARLWRSPLSLH